MQLINYFKLLRFVLILSIVISPFSLIEKPIEAAALTSGGVPQPLAVEGVSESEWASMQSQMAAAQYYFTWQVQDGIGAFRASNQELTLQVGINETGILLQNNAAFSLVSWDGTDLTETTVNSEKSTVTRQSESVLESVFNTSAGIDYQVSISQPAAQDQAILVYQIIGEMNATAYEDGFTITDPAGNWKGQFDQLSVVDAAGKALGAKLKVEDDQLIVLVNGLSSAVYPLTLRALAHTQSQKLTAGSEQRDNALFGSAVAIAGDVIVVGAPEYDQPSINTGAAFVFQRMQGGADNWGEVQMLTASNGLGGDFFGYSVAVWGDVIVVGAYGVDITGAGSKGAAYIFERRQGGADTWNEVDILSAADYFAGDQFGKSVAVWGDVVVVGADYKGSQFYTNDGAAYVFHRTKDGSGSWGQVQKLTASDRQSFDYFGRSVTISGDVIVVGAYKEDELGDSAGAAYVFQRMQGEADTWGQVQKLTASDGGTEHYFGQSVAAWGDVIVVGAYGNSAGAAYVFQRMSSTPDQWGQVQKLTSAYAQENDLFGISVAVSGDTIVVGAEEHDAGASNSGAAYVFHRKASTPDQWGQVQKLTASDAAADDGFGNAVAVSGNVVVVGSYYEDSNFTDNGAAYVYTGDSYAFQETGKPTAGDGEFNDVFGFSIAVSGDVLVVGADEEDDGGTNAGAAYVFHRMKGSADGWGQVQKLTASDPLDYDYFGNSVAVSGDVIVVGAYQEDERGNSAGAVYVYQRMQGGVDTWGEVKKLTASDGAEGDFFGRSVAVSGDVIVVGAQSADLPSKTNAGAAYVFYRSQGGTDNWGEVQIMTASDAQAFDQFGNSVAIDGDVIVVGANKETLDTGAAYVFHRIQDGYDAWGEVQKIIASDGVPDDVFGSAVAVSGDVIVVGAQQNTASQVDEPGVAYVFQRMQGIADGWGQVQKLVASDPAAGNRFGNSVAVSGDVIVVGAEGNTEFTGAAYVYFRPEATADAWVQVQRLIASNPSEGDYFGRAVAISGDVVAIGANGDDDIANNAGAAYIFQPLIETTDLSITKTCLPDPVGSGENLVYTLTVENLGPNEASDLVVTDVLPDGVSFQSWSGTGWACVNEESSGTVTCNRGSLAVEAAPDITIEVTAPSTGGTIENTASVSSSVVESDSSNNSDTCEVLVEEEVFHYIFLPLIVR